MIRIKFGLQLVAQMFALGILAWSVPSWCGQDLDFPSPSDSLQRLNERLNSALPKAWQSGAEIHPVDNQARMLSFEKCLSDSAKDRGFHQSYDCGQESDELCSAAPKPNVNSKCYLSLAFQDTQSSIRDHYATFSWGWADSGTGNGGSSVGDFIDKMKAQVRIPSTLAKFFSRKDNCKGGIHVSFHRITDSENGHKYPVLNVTWTLKGLASSPEDAANAASGSDASSTNCRPPAPADPGYSSDSPTSLSTVDAPK